MDHSLQELVESQVLQRLVNNLAGVLRLPVLITDRLGNVIADTAQFSPLPQFHRQHPEFGVLRDWRGAEAGPGPMVHKCPLGLAYFSTPVRIGGRHVADLKMGHAFLEPPEEDAFRGLALQHGVDEEPLLEAVRAIPVLDEEQTRMALAYAQQLVETLGDMGLSRQKELEALEALRQANEELKRANDYNRGLIEASADAIAVVGLDGIVTDVNTAAERLTGKSRAELIGSKVGSNFVSPAVARAALARAFRDGSVSDLEMELKHVDGHVTPVLFSLAALRDGSGAIHGLRVTAKDLTRRKRYEERISRAEQYRLLADNSTDVIMRLTPDGVCTYISPACERVLGYQPEELIGVNLTVQFHPDDMGNYLAARAGIRFNGNRNFVFQVRWVLKDGTHLWTEASGQVFFNGSGVPTEVQVSLRDISDRMQAKKALEASERRYRGVFESMVSGLAQHELIYEDGRAVDYIITEVNPAFTANTGIPREQATGARATVLYGTAEAPYLDIYAQVAETGKPARFETYFPPMGRHFSISVFSPGPGQFACVFKDVTDRILAVRELKAAKEYAEELIDTANAIVLVLDTEGRVQEFNRTAEHLTGWKKEELVGKNWFETAAPKDRFPEVWDGFRRIGENGFPSIQYNGILTKDGSVRQIAWSNSLMTRDGKVAGIVSFGMDITGKLEMERELHGYQERLSLVMKNLDAVVFQLDRDGKCQLAEGRGLEKLGLTPAGALGRDYAEIMNFDARAMAAYRRAAAGKDATTEVMVGPTIFQHTVSPFYGSDGRREGMIGLSVDITGRIQAEQKLREEKERLRITLQSIGDGVIATDGTGRVVLMNPVAEQLTGWTARLAMGKLFEEVFDIHNEETGAKCENPVDRVLSTGVVIGLANHTALRSRDGTVRSIADSAAPILDEAKRVLGVILVFRDVTEEKKKEEEIAFLSYHDRLTGLYNRAFLEEETRRLDTARQLPISVIMGDVNGLKLTNDVFGHAEGDQLLSRIAAILKECCRNEDIVARVGGDEFCILLPKTSYGQAAEICKRIYARCEKADGGQQAGGSKLSISLGCGTKTEANLSLDAVMKTAEDAMYRRKLLESRSQHSFLISSIRTTLFEKSFETEKHAQRLITYSKAIAQALGLPDDEVNDIELFALLHDIGKIAIDSHILTKPGKLTETEWEEMRRHPEIGFRIAQSSPDLAHISEYILCHHERWDGSGYPQGLKGTSIPLMARILLVVDAYDAMTQDRVYRKAMSREDACAELLLNAGTQFDPNVVWAFLELLERGEEFS